jgi:hypothetical protein
MHKGRVSTGWVNKGDIQRKGRNHKLLARVATRVSSGRNGEASEKQDEQGRAGATGFDPAQAHQARPAPAGAPKRYRSNPKSLYSLTINLYDANSKVMGVKYTSAFASHPRTLRFIDQAIKETNLPPHDKSSKNVPCRAQLPSENFRPAIRGHRVGQPSALSIDATNCVRYTSPAQRPCTDSVRYIWAPPRSTSMPQGRSDGRQWRTQAWCLRRTKETNRAHLCLLYNIYMNGRRVEHSRFKFRRSHLPPETRQTHMPKPAGTDLAGHFHRHGNMSPRLFWDVTSHVGPNCFTHKACFVRRERVEESPPLLPRWQGAPFVTKKCQD